MLADSDELFLACFFLHFVIYFGAPVVLFRKGWPIVGGLVMLASMLLPIAGQTWFTDSEAPGLAFLMMLELPPALLVLAVAISITSARVIKGLRNGAAERARSGPAAE